MKCTDAKNLFDMIDGGEVILRITSDDGAYGTVTYSAGSGVEIDVFDDAGDFDYVEEIRVNGQMEWASFVCREDSCSAWHKFDDSDFGGCVASWYRPTDHNQSVAWLWGRRDSLSSSADTPPA